MLTSVVAHYASWYVLFVAYWPCSVFLDRCRGSLDAPPANPLFVLVGAVALPFWSLLFAGQVSLLAGPAIGALCVRRSNEHPKMSARALDRSARPSYIAQSSFCDNGLINATYITRCVDPSVFTCDRFMFWHGRG
jgi:hypothetical protein